jgi:acyl-CoA dehydrogenase
VNYKAPVSDMIVMMQAVSLQENGPCYQDDGLTEAILHEAGRFAAEALAPLNWTGDRQGARRNEDGSLTMPSGFGETYRQWCEAGWNSLTAQEAYGGQGLSHLLASAVNEIWSAANVAFHLCPLLTTGAVEALQVHASDDLKQAYLPKLVSGEWTGTMNLTEPQAGSDLSTIKTRAVRQDDGSFRLFGQKIYITYGEHDMTDNIIHLVLARIEGAPEGTKGISLFLVPKMLPDGSRNDVICTGTEHKLGIHASPTCTMVYGDEDGATGWLVGEENRGLNCMFTMMNNARLNVGLQGVGLADRATQAALTFAHERKQGSSFATRSGGSEAIVVHGDVRRMLLDMKTRTAMSRAICMACAHAMDLSDEPDLSAEDCLYYKDLAALLTPIAKSFSTDIGVDVASQCIQVYGGMGYIEETGVAQFLRDARIAPIYEGTNGIQAMDLALRKVHQQEGKVIRRYLSELKASMDQLAETVEEKALKEAILDVEKAFHSLQASSDMMLQWRLGQQMDKLSAVAMPYLTQWGYALGSAYLIRAALLTFKNVLKDSNNVQRDSYERFQSLASFAVKTYLPQGHALFQTIENGHDRLVESNHPVFAL